MRVLIFGGSKGGCGKTTVSVLCATGLGLRGLRVAHLQVLAPGRQGIRISPRATFSSFHIPDLNELGPTITGRGDVHIASQDALVVDLPVTTSSALDLGCVEATLFLPVRPGLADRVALRQDIDELVGLAAENFRGARALNGIHVVPVGFPPDKSPGVLNSTPDFAKSHSRIAFSVIEPGVPYLDPLDLHLWIGGGDFSPNNQECFYAKELADAAWRCSDMQI